MLGQAILVHDCRIWWWSMALQSILVGGAWLSSSYWLAEHGPRVVTDWIRARPPSPTLTAPGLVSNLPTCCGQFTKTCSGFFMTEPASSCNEFIEFTAIMTKVKHSQLVRQNDVAQQKSQKFFMID